MISLISSSPRPTPSSPRKRGSPTDMMLRDSGTPDRRLRGGPTHRNDFRKLYRSKGFTLLEVMVALLVIAIGLGAVVEVSDIREVVKEQIESLGGKFIPLPEREESGEGEGGYAREMSSEYLAEQRRIVAEHVSHADVVICTALVPGKKGDRGRTGTDNRLFVDAVLWLARTAAPWRDLPPELGNWRTVHCRFRRWTMAGVWQDLFKVLAEDPDFEYVLVPSRQIAAQSPAG